MNKRIGFLILLIASSLCAFNPPAASKRKKEAAAAEALKREQDALDKQRRDQEEARLKAEIERNANAENSKKLVAEIHAKNAQIDQLTKQITQLQTNVAEQKLTVDTATLEAQGQRDQIAQLQKDLAHAQSVRTSTTPSKADEELRTRLKETEKALQAQTKRADDCEKLGKDSSTELAKVQQELKKQIDECRKMQSSQESLAKQAQQSDIIRKKQDELYATNQKYEKQVLDLTHQLEQAKKEVTDLKTEDNQKADKIFTLEADAEAQKQLKEKAQKELASIQKEIRDVIKDLKEQKEAYNALSASLKDVEKKAAEKCSAEIAAAKSEYNKSLKEETAKIYKNAQEQIAKFKENNDTAMRKAISEATAAKEGAISFANSLMRQKEIKPKDIQDLIDILRQK